jgi:Flp pilus assembly pilin Flp
VRRIRELARDQKGGTLIEYGLILGLIFVVMMIGVHALAIQAVGTINHVSNAVISAPDL